MLKAVFQRFPLNIRSILFNLAHPVNDVEYMYKVFSLCLCETGLKTGMD